MKYLARWILSILGWKIAGQIPSHKKMVIIVAPHTSNWDFVLGVVVRKALNVKINYVGKEALFIPPWGWLFRYLGGRPVVRNKSSNQVDQVISIFAKEQEFRLALSPEGTRKKVERWRTGFYYIAVGAKVPIVKVAFDFPSKTVSIDDVFYPSGDLNSDMENFTNFYRDKRGKN